MTPKSDPSLHHSLTPSLQPVDVAAGLIFRDGKLLITQRHADSHLGGLWEFPGGKRETGETFEQCLKRELKEELEICVRVGDRFESVTHAYPEKTVHLEFFLCEIESGDPHPHGCARLKWVTRRDLPDHEFPAADRQLIEKLQNSNLW
jgi:mutator protein MutT